MPIVFDEIETTVVADGGERGTSAPAAERDPAPAPDPLSLQRDLVRLRERAQRLVAD